MRQANQLELNANNEWAVFINKIENLNGILDNFVVDSIAFSIDEIKEIDLSKAHRKQSTLEFENYCYHFNKNYLLIKSELKDSLNLAVIHAVDNKMHLINTQIQDYNLACKKHNVFVRTLPNLYFIDNDKRKSLPFFSILFNQENLDPSLYKRNFDKYMETGHDRFLKPINKKK